MADNVGRYVRFITSIDGLDDIKRLLAHAERRMLDMSPVLRGEVNDITQGWLKRVFDSEGAAAGQKWKPLTFDSRKAKAKSGFPDQKIMQRSLRGMLSLTQPTADAIIRVHKRSYERGTALAYMYLQNAGYTVSRWGSQNIGPIEVPARRWMPKTLSEQTRQRYVDAIAKHILVSGGRGFKVSMSTGEQRFD
jgi:hypothetical protein